MSIPPRFLYTVDSFSTILQSSDCSGKYDVLHRFKSAKLDCYFSQLPWYNIKEIVSFHAGWLNQPYLNSHIPLFQLDFTNLSQLFHLSEHDWVLTMLELYWDSHTDVLLAILLHLKPHHQHQMPFSLFHNLLECHFDHNPLHHRYWRHFKIALWSLSSK